MRTVSVEESEAASLPAAGLCRENIQRHHLAEPLWFALMCREIFGPNAAKELQYLLSKSDRTCRAWASGDSEPPAGILATLIVSEHGFRIVAWIVRGTAVVWWSNVQRALRRSEAIDGADNESDQ